MLRVHQLCSGTQYRESDVTRFFVHSKVGTGEAAPTDVSVVRTSREVTLQSRSDTVLLGDC